MKIVNCVFTVVSGIFLASDVASGNSQAAMLDGFIFGLNLYFLIRT